MTVYTEAGRKLGITFFLYVDGIIRSNSDVTQTLGLFSLPDQGMWIWKSYKWTVD